MIYNIILPSSSLESDFFGNSTLCSGSTATAWHFHQTPSSAEALAGLGVALLGAYTGGIPGALAAILGGLATYQGLQGPPIYTIESANPKCGSLVNNLFHEMVEAATDPFPPPNVVLSGTGEIADLCATAPPSTPFVPPPSSVFPTFGSFARATVSVPQYWSNSGQRCVGFSDTTVPSPGVLQLSQNGGFNITGQGFGTPPNLSPLGSQYDPILTPGLMGLFDESPYLHIQVQADPPNSGVSLFGDILDELSNSSPTGGVDIQSWNETSIVALALNFGSISFWVCNPASGLCGRGSALPAVFAVNPNTVQCGSSTSIKITGESFFDVRSVSLNGGLVTLNHTVDSISQITATIPSSIKGGTYELTVETSAGSSAGVVQQPKPVLVSVPPTITAISPTSGPAAGGTSVTVNGTCLDGNAYSFRFGANSAPGYYCSSSTQCSVTSPGGTVGVVDVITSVGMPAAQSASTSADQFSYTAPIVTFISPSTGPITGGTSVSLSGSGFPVPGMQVSFVGAGGISANAQAKCVVHFLCNVVTPAVAHTGQVDIIATVPGGSSVTSPGDVFSYTTQYPALTQILCCGFYPNGNTVVQLNGNAPAGGAVIALSSSDPQVVTVPGSVVADGGRSSASFALTQLPTPNAETVTITASYQGSSVSTALNVASSPPLKISPLVSTLAYGQTANINAAINTPAPPGGAVVVLSSSDASALPVPGNVTIRAGAYTATFTAPDRHAGSPEQVTINATYGSASASATLTLANTVTGTCTARSCPTGYYWNKKDCLCERPKVPRK